MSISIYGGYQPDELWQKITGDDVPLGDTKGVHLALAATLKIIEKQQAEIEKLRAEMDAITIHLTGA